MINAAGVPLLLAAMALSSGVALCLGAGLLLRRTDVEGYMYVIAEYVWVTLWVAMAFAVFAVVGVVVFRMLSRRLTRPIEKFARDVDESPRSTPWPLRSTASSLSAPASPTRYATSQGTCCTTCARR